MFTDDIVFLSMEEHHLQGSLGRGNRCSKREKTAIKQKKFCHGRPRQKKGRVHCRCKSMGSFFNNTKLRVLEVYPGRLSKSEN